MALLQLLGSKKHKKKKNEVGKLKNRKDQCDFTQVPPIELIQNKWVSRLEYDNNVIYQVYVNKLIRVGYL